MHYWAGNFLENYGSPELTIDEEGGKKEIIMGENTIYLEHSVVACVGNLLAFPATLIYYSRGKVYIIFLSECLRPVA